MLTAFVVCIHPALTVVLKYVEFFKNVTVNHSFDSFFFKV